jgi:hypothetical protein
MIDAEIVMSLAEKETRRFADQVDRATRGERGFNRADSMHYLGIWQGIAAKRGIWSALAPYERKEVLESADDAGVLPIDLVALAGELGAVVGAPPGAEEETEEEPEQRSGGGTIKAEAATVLAFGLPIYEQKLEIVDAMLVEMGGGGGRETFVLSNGDAVVDLAKLLPEQAKLKIMGPVVDGKTALVNPVGTFEITVRFVPGRRRS